MGFTRAVRVTTEAQELPTPGASLEDVFAPREGGPVEDVDADLCASQFQHAGR